VARSWIARLRGKVRASLAASTGVETADDVAAYLLAGADVVMTTSSLLRHGPAHAKVLLDGLTAWMERKGFGGSGEVRGMLAAGADAAGPGYGRSGYLSAVGQGTRVYGPR
jgi:dihydroorotate dehydrogenase (fumarate)